MALGPTHITFKATLPPNPPKLPETPASNPSSAIPQPPPGSWHRLLSDKPTLLPAWGTLPAVPSLPLSGAPSGTWPRAGAKGLVSFLALGSARGRTWEGAAGCRPQLCHSLVLRPWASLSTFLSLPFPSVKWGEGRVVRVTWGGTVRT